MPAQARSMTPPVLPMAAFAGSVPANLPCGFCGRPVKRQFFRTLNRFACTNCAAQVNAVIAKNSVTPPTLLAAAGAGLAAALAGGAAWAIVVHVTHFNIGIIAAFIGVGVGKTVHFASGKRRSVSLQWLSTILAVIGVAVGKLGIVCWEIVDAVQSHGGEASVENIMKILHRDPHLLTGDPFDLVWMGIAGYAAWRLCKPQIISMSGPYAYEPAASSPAGGLQFNTVEPLQDIPPATPPGHP